MLTGLKLYVVCLLFLAPVSIGLVTGVERIFFFSAYVLFPVLITPLCKASSPAPVYNLY